ncbi:MAG: LCP family protein [Bacillota bacterium]
MEKNTKKWILIVLALLLFFIAFYIYNYYPQLLPGLADVNNEVERDINILLLGLDDTDSVKKEEIETDSIILLNYIAESESIRVNAYSPETKVNDNKLKELSRTEIEENIEKDSDEKIDYYFSVSYNGFIEFIDEINGININLDEELNISDLNLNLQEGENHLNGEETLNYLRWYGYDYDKVERLKRQEKVIRAISDKLISSNKITDIPKLFSTIVEGYRLVESNLDQKLLSDLVKLFQNKENVKIEYEIIENEE